MDTTQQITVDNYFEYSNQEQESYTLATLVSVALSALKIYIKLRFIKDHQKVKSLQYLVTYCVFFSFTEIVLLVQKLVHKNTLLGAQIQVEIIQYFFLSISLYGHVLIDDKKQQYTEEQRKQQKIDIIKLVFVDIADIPIDSYLTKQQYGI